MLRILIIDDDPQKCSHVLDLLGAIPEVSRQNIAVAEDLVRARDILSKAYFDLLILDIMLPSIPGEAPTLDAGKQFVRELRMSRTLIKPAHVIGLTSFDDALTGADSAFLDELWRLIKYDPTSDGWVRQLKLKVHYLIQSKHELQAGTASYDYDLAIITALWKPELKAVMALPLQWEARTFANDGTDYFVGLPRAAASPIIRVVAASCSQMGIAPAAVLTTKLIHHFRPRFLAMCGIAAGVKASGVHLGDILIVEQSWDYESGLRRPNVDGDSVLHPDPHHIPISADLRDKFAQCIGKDKYLADIEALWKGEKPERPIRVRLGPVASGAAIVEDESLVQGVKDHARKLIGIDMETYGVFFASQNCCKPRPSPFSIKSVVDLADPKKNIAFHEYGAFTSAQFLWRFALDHLALAPDPGKPSGSPA